MAWKRTQLDDQLLQEFDDEVSQGEQISSDFRSIAAAALEDVACIRPAAAARGAGWVRSESSSRMS